MHVLRNTAKSSCATHRSSSHSTTPEAAYFETHTITRICDRLAASDDLRFRLKRYRMAERYETLMSNGSQGVWDLGRSLTLPGIHQDAESEGKQPTSESAFCDMSTDIGIDLDLDLDINCIDRKAFDNYFGPLPLMPVSDATQGRSSTGVRELRMDSNDPLTGDSDCSSQIRILQSSNFSNGSLYMKGSFEQETICLNQPCDNSNHVLCTHLEQTACDCKSKLQSLRIREEAIYVQTDSGTRFTNDQPYSSWTHSDPGEVQESSEALLNHQSDSRGRFLVSSEDPILYCKENSHFTDRESYENERQRDDATNTIGERVLQEAHLLSQSLDQNLPMYRQNTESYQKLHILKPPIHKYSTSTSAPFSHAENIPGIEHRQLMHEVGSLPSRSRKHCRRKLRSGSKARNLTPYAGPSEYVYLAGTSDYENVLDMHFTGPDRDCAVSDRKDVGQSSPELHEEESQGLIVQAEASSAWLEAFIETERRESERNHAHHPVENSETDKMLDWSLGNRNYSYCDNKNRLKANPHQIPGLNLDTACNSTAANRLEKATTSDTSAQSRLENAKIVTAFPPRLTHEAEPVLPTSPMTPREREFTMHHRVEALKLRLDCQGYSSIVNRLDEVTSADNNERKSTEDTQEETIRGEPVISTVGETSPIKKGYKQDADDSPAGHPMTEKVLRSRRLRLRPFDDPKEELISFRRIIKKIHAEGRITSGRYYGLKRVRKDLDCLRRISGGLGRIIQDLHTEKQFIIEALRQAEQEVEHLRSIQR